MLDRLERPQINEQDSGASGIVRFRSSAAHDERAHSIRGRQTDRSRLPRLRTRTHLQIETVESAIDDRRGVLAEHLRERGQCFLDERRARAPWIARRRDQCRPEVEVARNPARELARRIDRNIPVIYGIGGLGGVAAMRWKQSMNENAKAPAFWNMYPELDHNEVCGWGQHGDVTRQLFTLIELSHGLEHPQLPRRAAATREIIEEALHQVLQVEAEGEGRLAQLLDLMYLGDWTSYYVALANDVDPGPIDAISQLKARLAH